MKPADMAPVRIAGHTIDQDVLTGIKAAAKKTGVSFSYLMAQAGRESSFDAGANSRASSAAGLYQFTAPTWLEMMNRHGAEHGYGDLARQIETGPKGELRVADPEARKAILELRRSPEVAALMAAEYAKGNKVRLEKHLKREATTTDLYLAHFLGPTGAAKLLQAREADAMQPASEVVPKAARHNPTIFYDDGRSPRSVAGVYQKIHEYIDRPMRQFAELGDSPAAPAPAPMTPVVDLAALAPPPAAPEPVSMDKPDPPPYAAEPPRHEPVRVALRDDAVSFDQISLPMPAPVGHDGAPTYSPAPNQRPGLSKVFESVKRSLFGESV